MNVSFGWTWPAFVAGAKTVTRRGWKDSYAKSCKQHVEHVAFDKQAWFGGSPIGIFELICDPAKESTREMPLDDYKKEGFLYLHQHSKLIPKSSPFSFSMTDFNEWREDDETLWVIRFRPIFIFSEALDRLEKLKRLYGYQ